MRIIALTILSLVVTFGGVSPAFAKKQQIHLYFCNHGDKPIGYRFHGKNTKQKISYVDPCHCSDGRTLKRSKKAIANEKIQAQAYQAVYRGVGKDKKVSLSFEMSASGEMSYFESDSESAEASASASSETTTTWDSAVTLTHPIGGVRKVGARFSPAFIGDGYYIFRYGSTGAQCSKMFNVRTHDISGKILPEKVINNF